QEGIGVLHQGAEAAADIVVPVRHGPSAVLEPAIMILVPPGAWMTPSNNTNSDTIGLRISPLASRFRRPWPSARCRVRYRAPRISASRSRVPCRWAHLATRV